MFGWSTADIPDQTGRIAVVTGANSGLGLQTALALASAGASVVMAVRSPGRSAAAIEQVDRRGRVEVSQLDLASLRSVRDFAERTLLAHARIDLLINNAGVMAIPRDVTEDGFEKQFGTDHLGPFALTGLLLPVLARTTGARVVTVTSMARWAGRLRFNDLQGEHAYTRWSAYGQAKLANLVFAIELQRRLEAAGSPAISVAAHPGYARTNLQATSASVSNARWEAMTYPIAGLILGQSAAGGARPQLYAATAPGVRGGALYAPRLVVRGPVGREPVEPRARNPQVGRRLFEVSEQLTGVRYALPVAAAPRATGPAKEHPAKR